MDAATLKPIFLRRVETEFAPGDVEHCAKSLKNAGRKATAEQRIELAAAMAQAAFLAPDQVGQTYDALAQGWRGFAVAASPIETLANAPVGIAPDGLWDSWWSVVEDALAGKLDALAITQRTAALGEWMPDDFVRKVAASSHLYPGISDAAQADLPPHMTLERLATCPPGSLGRQFHDLIVDNTFDLEVLDRDALGLSALPKPLDFLNTRILQAHDLWHLTAGYETTALHEIAISAFQMAQFGHNYSAQFLSITAAVSALTPARGAVVLLDTITSAWVHGRETPPMMLIDWESELDRPLDEIRADYDIAPYPRPYPADLIEKAGEITAFAARIKSLFSRFFRGGRTAPI
ncbi:MAG: Coq4 family protein [Pseudomonadota bacterium]